MNNPNASEFDKALRKAEKALVGVKQASILEPAFDAPMERRYLNDWIDSALGNLESIANQYNRLDSR